MNTSFEINMANWEQRAAIHAGPNSYGVEQLVADRAALSHVVRFDLPRLGEVAGLRGVHLQCHIGTDTVSLARLGARMTGLDFSPTAIAHARSLAQKTGTDAEFVEANVYDAVGVLGRERFDLVYVSIGALCWLPEVKRWASVVAALLRPGGRLFLRDGHPMLFTLDDEADGDTLALRYPYFETAEPVVWDDDTTYIETDARLTATVTHEWNHGIGEIVTAVLDAGMRVTMLVEDDSTPYDALPGRMRQGPDGEWRLIDRPSRLPLTFTLQTRKERASAERAVENAS